VQNRPSLTKLRQRDEAAINLDTHLSGIGELLFTPFFTAVSWIPPHQTIASVLNKIKGSVSSSAIPERQPFSKGSF